MAGRQVSTTLELPTGAQPGQRAVSLFQLYKVATRLAAKSNEPAYLQLWLGYARHQGCSASPVLGQLRKALMQSATLDKPFCHMTACAESVALSVGE